MAEARRERSKRIFWKTFAIAIAALLLVFLFEDFAIRARMPPFRDPVAQIEVHRVYLLEKSRNKVNILGGEPEPQDCVRAIFPHLGDAPCWWLARHTEQQVKLQ